MQSVGRNNLGPKGGFYYTGVVLIVGGLISRIFRYQYFRMKDPHKAQKQSPRIMKIFATSKINELTSPPNIIISRLLFTKNYQVLAT